MEPLALAAFTGLVAVTGAAMFFGGRHMARRALSPVIRLEPQPARRGQKLTVNVFVRPTQTVQVDQIEVTLSCVRTEDERQKDGHMIADLLGFNRYHYDHYERDTVVRDHVVYPVQRAFQKGHPEEMKFEVEVHRDGFPTRRDGVLQIHWVLRVRFAIPGFPDAVLDRPVQVVN